MPALLGIDWLPVFCSRLIHRSRLSALGMSRHLVGDREIEFSKLMTEEEQEESYRRKFGPPA